MMWIHAMSCHAMLQPARPTLPDILQLVSTAQLCPALLQASTAASASTSASATKGATSAPEAELPDEPSAVQPAPLPANASYEEILDHALVTASLEVGGLHSRRGCSTGLLHGGVVVWPCCRQWR